MARHLGFVALLLIGAAAIGLIASYVLPTEISIVAAFALGIAWGNRVARWQFP